MASARSLPRLRCGQNETESLWVPPTSGEKSAQLAGKSNGCVAAVDVAFGNGNTSMTGTYGGVAVPQNVANVCTYTWMCSNRDIHANSAGHQPITQSFRTVVRAVVAGFATGCVGHGAERPRRRPLAPHAGHPLPPGPDHPMHNDPNNSLGGVYYVAAPATGSQILSQDPRG